MGFGSGNGTCDVSLIQTAGANCVINSCALSVQIEGKLSIWIDVSVEGQNNNIIGRIPVLDHIEPPWTSCWVSREER